MFTTNELSHNFHNTPEFKTAVNNAGNAKALVKFLARYVAFNSVFGAGVSNLTGAIASRGELFIEKNVAPTVASRSSEVASPIFFAAIDEFGGNGGKQKTHAQLAQETVCGAAVYYSIDMRDITLNDATRAAQQAVLQGYGVGLHLTIDQLFHAIGFHIGSELLADQEFCELADYLNGHDAALVEYLKIHHAYLWIHVHTSVEADHFASAVDAANLAMKHVSEAIDPHQLQQWIKEGIKQFVNTQKMFMQHVLD